MMDLRGVKCVMIAMLLFFLAGCVPGGLPIVEITDDINVTTTWEGGTIYVINEFDFWVNATLEIEPGAIIKFDSSEGPGMNVDGTVIALSLIHI